MNRKGIPLKEPPVGWFFSGSFHFSFPAGLTPASRGVRAAAPTKRGASSEARRDLGEHRGALGGV